MVEQQASGPAFFTFQPQIHIPVDVDIVFVADLFVEDYVGGAELTTEALIGSCPFKVFRLHSKDVSMELLKEGHEKFWVFGNFANLDMKLIPTIATNMRYSVLEYDYKYCRHRSPEKHKVNENKDCNCHEETHGKMIATFLYAAKSLWWMSEAQKAHYDDLFPYLREKPSTVLSSVFDEETFATIHVLQDKYKDEKRKGWIVLGSPSWIKGQANAEAWCDEQGHEYETVWNLPYLDVLRKLAQAEGFVYLPPGADTCPRMVIEAKLLGCKLHLNDNVQHAKEDWFQMEDLDVTESYLFMARERFWNGIYSDMGESDITISGYTTTYNCVENDYPFHESIVSMLGFCDEVVVVDAGSNDGTWEALNALADAYETLVIYQQPRDREKKRWAIDFDGRLKALARALCTQAFCWQQDSDEVVNEGDYAAIAKLVKHFPPKADVLCLPVIEYWGSSGKVRADIHNWKWRLSRNRAGITHGIPAELRRFDENGELYAARGTDSCDYINLGDYSRIPFMNFYTEDVERIRRNAMEEESEESLKEYEGWYNEVVEHLPGVHHYSWFNIERKIKSYRNYWARFWESMYNQKQDDTAENNMFFDKPWSDVTDEEIEDVAIRLEDEMGGWIFHRKVNWDAKTAHIECTKEHPALMDDWIERNSYEPEEEDEEYDA